jgi:hypothetical protein
MHALHTGSSRSSSRSATAGMLAGVVGKLGAGGHTRNGSRGAGVAAMEPLHEHEGEETAGETGTWVEYMVRVSM